MTVLCFVQDAAPVFAEIIRVLRPSGKLMIGELGKWSSWAAARRIRAWLGSLLWRRGRFRTATELVPDYFDVWNGLSLALSLSGLDREAVEAARAAVRASAANRFGYVALAHALRVTGQFEDRFLARSKRWGRRFCRRSGVKGRDAAHVRR